MCERADSSPRKYRVQLTEKDTLVDSSQVPSNWRHENDAGDQVFSVAWTGVLSNRATNELRFGHTRETLLQGSPALFDDQWNFIGLDGRDQFDLGPQNSQADPFRSVLTP